MWEDPIVAEVHRIREQLAAKFGFDVDAIFADIMRRQTALGNRLVSRKKHAEPQNGPESQGATPPGMQSKEKSLSIERSAAGKKLT